VLTAQFQEPDGKAARFAANVNAWFVENRSSPLWKSSVFF
jgi:hypothetical protein